MILRRNVLIENIVFYLTQAAKFTIDEFSYFSFYNADQSNES